MLKTVCVRAHLDFGSLCPGSNPGRVTSSTVADLGALGPHERLAVSAADAEAGPLQESFHLVARDPGEVAGERVFEGTGRDAITQTLLHLAVEQAVDQPRRERVARPQPIDYFDLVSPCSVQAAFGVGDAGPAVLPHQWVLAQGDRHDLKGEAFG